METALLTLIPILQEAFKWNLSRTKCAAAIIIGLIKTRSVNLVQLATALPGEAKIESKYRRIQRLMKDINIDMETIAHFIANQLPQTKYTLLIDRTDWKFGNTYINILFLTIYHQGYTIPILWTTLPQSKKCGNTNTKERILLIKQFIEIFGIEKIESVIGDREFIGTEWFNYLIDNNINFLIRIKHNIKISRVNGGSAPARNFFRNLRCGESIQLSNKRKIFGVKLYITGMKLQTGELLIIAHNYSASCEQVLNDYKKRWGIECFFKTLKSEGFDFETTHLTDPKKIDKLIAFMAIACVWSCKTGEWLNNEEDIKVKKHGRKAISIFRYGLDYLREIFFNIEEKICQLQMVLGLIQRVPNRFGAVLNC